MSHIHQLLPKYLLESCPLLGQWFVPGYLLNSLSLERLLLIVSCLVKPNGGDDETQNIWYYALTSSFNLYSVQLLLFIPILTVNTLTLRKSNVSEVLGLETKGTEI